MIRFTALAFTLLAATASPLRPPRIGAGSGDDLTVTTRPARLVKGALGTIQLRLPAGRHPEIVEGSAAGEPLHFHRQANGRYAALIAAPIAGQDTLRVSIVVDGDTTEIRLPLAEGSYRHEQLRVAQKFAKPDSAAQERIRGEIDQARAISRSAHDTPRLWQGAFLPPRSGRITSRFGTAREFNGEVLSRHMGTDFAGKVGAPVRATNRGVVTLVADFYLAGTAVYIDHGEGLVTGYFHLSRALVAQGDTVRRGQIIGRVGQSGRVTGPHLHWVARLGNISVDPASLLNLVPKSGS
ncbi:MAG TPA: M23 family metallopeptidase [Gemmatimonadales bacterium]|nr:M23 family metallopeptidase [Gemmatimonadales bacterium]